MARLTGPPEVMMSGEKRGKGAVTSEINVKALKQIAMCADLESESIFQNQEGSNCHDPHYCQENTLAILIIFDTTIPVVSSESDTKRLR